MAWLACGVPAVWLITSSWFAILLRASWRCSARCCSFWFMTNVDVPKNYLFRSGKRSRYLCQRRDQGRPETGSNPCGWPVTSACDIWYILAEILRCPQDEVKNSQRLTYDTFWRTFYAVLTTRLRIRNDWHMIHFGGHFTLFSQRGQEFATMNFNRTAIIHDPSLLIRVQYLFNIGL